MGKRKCKNEENESENHGMVLKRAVVILNQISVEKLDHIDVVQEKHSQNAAFNTSVARLCVHCNEWVDSSGSLHQCAECQLEPAEPSLYQNIETMSSKVNAHGDWQQAMITRDAFSHLGSKQEMVSEGIITSAELEFKDLITSPDQKNITKSPHINAANTTELQNNVPTTVFKTKITTPRAATTKRRSTAGIHFCRMCHQPMKPSATHVCFTPLNYRPLSQTKHYIVKCCTICRSNLKIAPSAQKPQICLKCWSKQQVQKVLLTQNDACPVAIFQCQHCGYSNHKMGVVSSHVGLRHRKLFIGWTEDTKSNSFNGMKTKLNQLSSPSLSLAFSGSSASALSPSTSKPHSMKTLTKPASLPPSSLHFEDGRLNGSETPSKTQPYCQHGVQRSEENLTSTPKGNFQEQIDSIHHVLSKPTSLDQHSSLCNNKLSHEGYFKEQCEAQVPCGRVNRINNTLSSRLNSSPDNLEDPAIITDTGTISSGVDTFLQEKPTTSFQAMSESEAHGQEHTMLRGEKAFPFTKLWPMIQTDKEQTNEESKKSNLHLIHLNLFSQQLRSLPKDNMEVHKQPMNPAISSQISVTTACAEQSMVRIYQDGIVVPNGYTVHVIEVKKVSGGLQKLLFISSQDLGGTNMDNTGDDPLIDNLSMNQDECTHVDNIETSTDLGSSFHADHENSCTEPFPSESKSIDHNLDTQFVSCEDQNKIHNTPEMQCMFLSPDGTWSNLLPDSQNCPLVSEVPNLQRPYEEPGIKQNVNDVFHSTSLEEKQEETEFYKDHGFQHLKHNHKRKESEVVEVRVKEELQVFSLIQQNEDNCFARNIQPLEENIKIDILKQDSSVQMQDKHLSSILSQSGPCFDPRTGQKFLDLADHLPAQQTLLPTQECEPWETQSHNCEHHLCTVAAEETSPSCRHCNVTCLKTHAASILHSKAKFLCDICGASKAPLVFHTCTMAMKDVKHQQIHWQFSTSAMFDAMVATPKLLPCAYNAFLEAMIQNNCRAMIQNNCRALIQKNPLDDKFVFLIRFLAMTNCGSHTITRKNLPVGMLRRKRSFTFNDDIDGVGNTTKYVRALSADGFTNRVPSFLLLNKNLLPQHVTLLPDTSKVAIHSGSHPLNVHKQIPESLLASGYKGQASILLNPVQLTKTLATCGKGTTKENYHEESQNKLVNCSTKVSECVTHATQTPSRCVTKSCEEERFCLTNLQEYSSVRPDVAIPKKSADKVDCENKNEIEDQEELGIPDFSIEDENMEYVTHDVLQDQEVGDPKGNVSAFQAQTERKCLEKKKHLSTDISSTAGTEEKEIYMMGGRKPAKLHNGGQWWQPYEALALNLSSTTYPPGVFQCWFCGRRFSNHAAWLLHGQRHLIDVMRDDDSRPLRGRSTRFLATPTIPAVSGMSNKHVLDETSRPDVQSFSQPSTTMPQMQHYNLRAAAFVAPSPISKHSGPQKPRVQHSQLQGGE
uniref:C2H2-type domain-containing protein n=1 Tax=Eptatretus burgeri TaxID=7764 RepID=A0A8C4QIX4_EPTBU